MLVANSTGFKSIFPCDSFAKLNQKYKMDQTHKVEPRYLLKLTELIQQSERYLSNRHTDTGNIAFIKAKVSSTTKGHKY